MQWRPTGNESGESIDTRRGRHAMVRPTKTLFAPAYAATAHKVQGSEFPRVLVIDDGANPRNQWLYTAITRAQEKAAIWTP